MEPLNNDMDDLFRKAGDHYPLKTSGSDWDGVLGKLHDQSLPDQTAMPAIPAKTGRNKRRWLFLLLCISIGLGSVLYFSTGNKLQPAVMVNEIVKQPAVKSNSNSTRTKSSVLAGKLNTANTRFKKNQPVIYPGEQIAAGLKDGSVKNQSKRYPGNRANGIALTGGSGIVVAEKNQSNVMSGEVRESSTYSGPDSSSGIQNSATVNDSVQSVILPLNKPAAKQPDQKSQTDNIQIPAQQVTEKVKSTKGIYVGFVTGPDWSTVKFQSVKQTGFSLGIQAGYRFNNRLTIETGFIWDRKYYYSSGEYFKSNPPYSSSTKVDGNCNMLEIPVGIRYDFATEKKHGYFVKAGLSTYLMTHQYYSTDSNGYNSGSWPVNDFVSYPFSVVNLSGGYEFSIGEKTKIQIEPYIKIPLKGIGEGSMPISSAGIYFGISYSFR